MSEQASMQTAILGGGCFWCLEAVFEQMRGVQRVTSGYCGGHLAAPSYEAVCRGDSGHAEVVKIEFDAALVSYRELLEVFFAIHDPTTLDRQGNDVGSQYRSVIFYADETQRAEAASLMGALAEARVFADPIVTELTPASRFYPAETYHQGYFRGHESQPYCAIVVAPKLAKFRQKFGKLLK
ncbi:peptide-methionine (S)-S-oxide reductase MsrA [Niveibacterium sp.]|uniref:peptide-methionine (S)-S-oxide reductase MsrA n=1 Tax=Niveibacterium sp. TaxID=2017444 RepID=UPI0035B4A15A